MAKSVIPQLMFEGAAEEAIGLYVATVRDSAIVEVERYGPGEMGKEGTVKRAVFTLAGREYACIDSPVKHAFGFTPSISLFVECESEEELDGMFARLSEGGGVLMPPGNYGFGARFVWFNDRYGVSWQLRWM